MEGYINDSWRSCEHTFGIEMKVLLTINLTPHINLTPFDGTSTSRLPGRYRYILWYYNSYSTGRVGLGGARPRTTTNDHELLTTHDRARPLTHDSARKTAYDRTRTTTHDRPRMTDHARTTAHKRPRTTTQERPRSTDHASVDKTAAIFVWGSLTWGATL